MPIPTVSILLTQVYSTSILTVDIILLATYHFDSDYTKEGYRHSSYHVAYHYTMGPIRDHALFHNVTLSEILIT